MNLFLGIDTSAYTTSIAMVDDNYRIIMDERLALEVKRGERGLRQSEALFQHTKNLPFLFAGFSGQRGFDRVRAIGVSAFPRNMEGSYMPVFNVGLSLARCMSSFNRLPLYELSHQEGHIMAGLQRHWDLLQGDFLAVHFSGGTSEVLRVSRNNARGVFAIDILAAGLDLHAGQLIDRVGVAMGLPFPAGPGLERLAQQAGGQEQPLIPAYVRQNGFSFSGAETRALNMLKEGIAAEKVAFAVLRCLANTLEKIILMHTQSNHIREVLLVGGVMANSLIKERLLKRLEHPRVGLKLHFAEPRLSSDNAVGTALLAAYLYKQTGEV
jgi:N6-L-threonylcarbamoyladenine synthase